MPHSAGRLCSGHPYQAGEGGTPHCMEKQSAAQRQPRGAELSLRDMAKATASRGGRARGRAWFHYRVSKHFANLCLILPPASERAVPQVTPESWAYSQAPWFLPSCSDQCTTLPSHPQSWEETPKCLGSQRLCSNCFLPELVMGPQLPPTPSADPLLYIAPETK